MYKIIYRTTISLLLCSLVLQTMTSCLSTKKSSSTEEVLNQETLFQVSPRTQLFLSDYQKELKASKSSIQLFEPSTKMVDKYLLSKSVDGSYSLKGFAKTVDSFDKSSLESLGISMGSNMSGQQSLQIPLSSFQKFLQLEGISYFEIVEKANLKN